jgi:2-oxoisovalerate dehydrogenase E1 component beta subunit
MAEVTFLEAIREGLKEEMEHDDRVFLIGEDIGAYGGAFKITEGLYDLFGPQRVIDTPIAEAAVIGAAAGAAMNGMRPVAELQFIDFISCGGFDALVTVAAKSRYRNGMGCPLVVRGPCGAGGRGGPFHSACPEMWALTTPGIKVVFPSTPYDAKGLLKAAIRDPDPVLFLEHKYLYRRLKEDLPEDDYIVPLGQAIERHPGDDLVILSYGAMVHKSMEAAITLSKEGFGVRVIDLRSLLPLDETMILESVKTTGRVLVVHEHASRGGFAGELMALINQEAFDYLDAPPKRVTGPNTPVPYAPTLEDAYLPQVSTIVAEARKLLLY